MEGNVTMGKYLEYFEDVDLDMLVDHCLWLSEEGLKKLGEYTGNFFDKGTKHCIIVHRNWDSIFKGQMVRISDGIKYDAELSDWYTSDLYVVEIRIYFWKLYFALVIAKDLRVTIWRLIRVNFGTTI